MSVLASNVADPSHCCFLRLVLAGTLPVGADLDSLPPMMVHRDAAMWTRTEVNAADGERGV